MNKAIERPRQQEEMIGRFQMTIDADGEPVDWDSAVARFLLAVTARSSSTLAVAPAGQPSAAISLLELNEYSGPNFISDSCMVQGI
jgi:hypothetical protein